MFFFHLNLHTYSWEDKEETGMPKLLTGNTHFPLMFSFYLAMNFNPVVCKIIHTKEKPLALWQKAKRAVQQYYLWPAVSLPRLRSILLPQRLLGKLRWGSGMTCRRYKSVSPSRFSQSIVVTFFWAEIKRGSDKSIEKAKRGTVQQRD